MVESESVVDIKTGDSGVVIIYHVAQSHIYPGFTGKVSMCIHFQLEPGWEDCSYSDQAVED